jgi:uncharacterized membrane protein (UPF0127 family)
MKRRTGLLAGLLLVFAVNCTALGGKSSLKLETMELRIEKAGGSGAPVPIRAEIARSDDERARGLMNRKTLPDGEGMLFVFDRDQILSFWMKDTLIPLSIAYISSDGRILEIHDMIPRDLSPIRSSRSLRYALEVPQGWFSRIGAAVGDRLVSGDGSPLRFPLSSPEH